MHRFAGNTARFVYAGNYMLCEKGDTLLRAWQKDLRHCPGRAFYPDVGWHGNCLTIAGMSPKQEVNEMPLSLSPPRHRHLQ